MVREIICANIPSQTMLKSGRDLNPRI